MKSLKVIWIKSSTASKVWKVYRNASWPTKWCICLDRQNISPLYSLPLYPNKGIQMWMWSRETSVFPVDICKTLYLLSILEGSCFLLSFPPNWFSLLEVVSGVGAQQTRQTAVNLCLTPSWAQTTLPIKLTRPEASLQHHWAANNNTLIWISNSGDWEMLC